MSSLIETKGHLLDRLQRLKGRSFPDLCSLPEYTYENIFIMGEEIILTTMMYQPNASKVAIAVRSDQKKYFFVCGYTEGFWKYNDERIEELNLKDIQDCFE